MQRAYKSGIATFVVFTVLGSGSWLYAIVGKQAIHPLNEECASCHMAGANTTVANAGMLVGNQEQLCGGCHANALKMSHPSGFAPQPGRAVPAAYPLDWKGDLTCSTCHKVHSDLPGKMRGVAHGRQLCMACHDQTFFEKMADGGESVIMSGHLGIPNSQTWLTLDPYSIQCMECHDSRGDVAVDANLITRHGSQNHPVGRNYAEAERYGSYKPAAMLSQKIHLPNGKVSCVSCHETFTKNHGKLLTTGNITTLCFECHDL